MELRSVLVSVDLETPDSYELHYAVDLAGRLGAELIGVAAEQLNFGYAGIDGNFTADIYAIERQRIEKRIAAAHETFAGLVPAGLKRQWRAFIEDPTGAVIDTARRADIIVATSRQVSPLSDRQVVSLGDLVLAAGRPVIAVARAVRVAKIERVCIGWKDTREARRAVTDALPLLRLAKSVSAITVSEGDKAQEQSALDDLLDYLKRHGIAASAEIIDNPDAYDDVLATKALFQDADLVVMGGYGHSRMREWLFGGMTRRMLQADILTRLLSN